MDWDTLHRDLNGQFDGILTVADGCPRCGCHNFYVEQQILVGSTDIDITCLHCARGTTVELHSKQVGKGFRKCTTTASKAVRSLCDR